MNTTFTEPDGAQARVASAPQQPAFAPGGAHAPGGSAEARAAASPPPLPLLPQARAVLDQEFRALLQAGVNGLCFSPYVEGQAPGAEISEAQIRERDRKSVV